MKNIFLFLLVLNFMLPAHAYNSAKFQESLAKIQPKLKGKSLILFSGDRHFHYATPGVNLNSQFYIGSLTKHITAYIFLITLQQQYPHANLSEILNAKLIHLFPKSTFLKNIKKKWVSKISSYDLLTHQSGLSDYLDLYDNGETISPIFKDPIPSLKLLKSVHFDPEKKYLYSNSNYLLLTKLTEEMTSKKFDHLFNAFIKSPAKMHASFAPIKGNYFTLKKQKFLKHLVPNLGPVFIDMQNALGSGNVISTVSDLKKWANYFFNTAPKDIVNLMLKNHGEDEDGEIKNFGFNTMKTPLGSLIFHPGDIDSYHSFFAFLPEKRAIIIILTNLSDDINLLLSHLLEWLSTPPSINMKQEKTLYTWSKSLEKIY